MIDDLQTTSATCFSSNKSETDYFKKADLHGTARSGAGEAYSVPYINTLIPTSATEDQFITTTTTSGTNQLSTKLSTGPVRFGHGTPTSYARKFFVFWCFVRLRDVSSNVITAVGRQAAEGSGVGTACTCVGYRAGDGSTGVRNTFMGHLAGNGVTGSDLFALGEGSMDGGTCNAVTGIGRYAFRGATANNCIGLGINVMGSGFGFHTYATNSVQRSGSNKFLVGDNTNTNNWTTANQYSGSPYLLDGTMGGYDSVREMNINADSIYFGSALPTSNSTAYKIWNDQGVLRYGSGSALTYTDTDTDNYITAFSLANGLLTGTMTGGQANPTGQILPANAAGFFTNDGQGNLSYSDGKLSNVVKSFNAAQQEYNHYSSAALTGVQTTLSGVRTQ